MSSTTVQPTAAQRIRDMACIAMLAALMAICSWISIPATVPLTMQTFGLFCAVGLLGGKRGTLAVLVYLLMGAVGLPVFAGFSGGLGTLLTPTGGYLVGFIFSALIYWAFTSCWGKAWWSMLISMVAGMVTYYVFGTVWFMIVYAQTTETIGLVTALGWCVVPFILPDVVKIALAMLLCQKVTKHVRLFD